MSILLDHFILHHRPFIKCTESLIMDSFYPQILQILSSAVVVEKNSGALDNICGALARLIIANASLIPLDQVNSFLYKEQHKDVRISGLQKRIRVS